LDLVDIALLSSTLYLLFFSFHQQITEQVDTFQIRNLAGEVFPLFSCDIPNW
jgi:hypothetical protein